MCPWPLRRLAPLLPSTRSRPAAGESTVVFPTVTVPLRLLPAVKSSSLRSDGLLHLAGPSRSDRERELGRRPAQSLQLAITHGSLTWAERCLRGRRGQKRGLQGTLHPRRRRPTTTALPRNFSARITAAAATDLYGPVGPALQTARRKEGALRPLLMPRSATLPLILIREMLLMPRSAAMMPLIRQMLARRLEERCLLQALAMRLE
jgi:hypothetical protein